jgi:hypothetical protein
VLENLIDNISMVSSTFFKDSDNFMNQKKYNKKMEKAEKGSDKKKK